MTEAIQKLPLPAVLRFDDDRRARQVRGEDDKKGENSCEMNRRTSQGGKRLLQAVLRFAAVTGAGQVKRIAQDVQEGISSTCSESIRRRDCMVSDVN